MTTIAKVNTKPRGQGAGDLIEISAITLTIAETAKLLQVDVRTVRNWLKDPHIPLPAYYGNGTPPRIYSPALPLWLALNDRRSIGQWDGRRR